MWSASRYQGTLYETGKLRDALGSGDHYQVREVAEMARRLSERLPK